MVLNKIRDLNFSNKKNYVGNCNRNKPLGTLSVCVGLKRNAALSQKPSLLNNYSTTSGPVSKGPTTKLPLQTATPHSTHQSNK